MADIGAMLREARMREHRDIAEFEAAHEDPRQVPASARGRGVGAAPGLHLRQGVPAHLRRHVGARRADARRRVQAPVPGSVGARAGAGAAGPRRCPAQPRAPRRSPARPRPRPPGGAARGPFHARTGRGAPGRPDRGGAVHSARAAQEEPGPGPHHDHSDHDDEDHDTPRRAAAPAQGGAGAGGQRSACESA